MDDIDDALAQSVDLAWKLDKLRNIIDDKDKHIASLKGIVADRDNEIARLMSLHQNAETGSDDSPSTK